MEITPCLLHLLSRWLVALITFNVRARLACRPHWLTLETVVAFELQGTPGARHMLSTCGLDFIQRAPKMPLHWGCWSITISSTLRLSDHLLLIVHDSLLHAFCMYYVISVQIPCVAPCSTSCPFVPQTTQVLHLWMVAPIHPFLAYQPNDERAAVKQTHIFSVW